MSATTTSTPVRRRTGIGWGDLAWLTWRQHRWAVVALGGLVVLGSAFSLVMASFSGQADADVPAFFREVIGFTATGRNMVILSTVFGGLVAVFWAAPLLAHEYEQRTYVLAWGQDLSPTRWLAGKVVLLVVPAVALAAGLGAATTVLLRAVNAWVASTRATQQVYLPFGPFGSDAFEAAPLMQAGYALFGFALGLALSAVFRRTLVAMAVTLGVFTVVRLLMANVWRPRFWSPERFVEPFPQPLDELMTAESALQDSLRVGSGFLDAAGNEVRLPICSGETEATYNQCLRESGIVSYYVDHHPVDRLVPFQLFEFALYGLLSAGLLVLAFGLVRRAYRL
ncbi:hypothetical protein AB0I60_17355 [Actinosynnema sp. NPDC050436]|uniref:hypothetical protein n=1 Tax=Actinosynnema sp. NPDC050436 TaxID=3155659 RepID=UPI0033CE8AD8